MRPAAVTVLFAAVTAAMLWPALRRPPLDDFPLSNYPMFSSARGSRSAVHTVLGVTATGEHETLSPALISGDPWPVLAVEVTAKARRGGPAARLELCEAVAARVAADPDRAKRYNELVFVTEVYDTHRYFSGDSFDGEDPLSREVLATCPLP